MTNSSFNLPFKPMCSRVIFVTALSLFGASALTLFIKSGWHDQQRSAQLVMLLLCTCLGFRVRLDTLPRSMFWCIAGFFILGGLSAAAAARPIWAFRELATWLLLTTATLMIAQWLRSKKFSQVHIAAVLTALMAVLGWQYIVACIAGLLSASEFTLKPYNLFSGFSNPRFLGQFQVIALPFVAWAALEAHTRRGTLRWASFFVVLASVHWLAAISLAGRGALAALACGHVVLALASVQGRRLALIQLMAALTGVFLYYFTFHILPLLLNAKLQLHDPIRTTLAGRDVLWRMAWDMAASEPWLGWGPMMFATQNTHIGAHPHQLILQLASEWGWPATVLAGHITIRGLYKGARVLRSPESEPLDAAILAALVGSIALAQVDGVFVMPYTQLWLSMVIALALARWQKFSNRYPLQISIWRLAAIPAAVVLLFSLIEGPPPSMGAEAGSGLKARLDPRFWQRGYIQLPERENPKVDLND